jgi:hypothetical protein
MRRRSLVALLAIALAAACGGDDGTAGTATTRADGGVATTTPGAGTTAATAPGPAGPSGRPPTTIGGGAVAPPTTTVGSSLAPGGVGDLAGALLRPGNGNRIVVEVRAQAAASPVAGTVDQLTRVLRDASGKVVVVDGIDAMSGGAREWSAGAIVAAADAAADHRQGGTQVVLRVLFLRGTFEGDDSVLGVAVRGDVAAVFSDGVEATGGLLASAATIERAVTIHEAGHLLGLVDLAIDTGRDDPEHPGHSTNDRSVMHWAVESDVVTQVLGGGVPTEFDAADRADLARIRAG